VRSASKTETLQQRHSFVKPKEAAAAAAAAAAAEGSVLATEMSAGPSEVYPQYSLHQCPAPNQHPSSKHAAVHRPVMVTVMVAESRRPVNDEYHSRVQDSEAPPKAGQPRRRQAGRCQTLTLLALFKPVSLQITLSLLDAPSVLLEAPTLALAVLQQLQHPNHPCNGLMRRHISTPQRCDSQNLS